jgi:hypothetical protein
LCPFQSLPCQPNRFLCPPDVGGFAECLKNYMLHPQELLSKQNISAKPLTDVPKGRNYATCSFFHQYVNNQVIHPNCGCMRYIKFRTKPLKYCTGHCARGKDSQLKGMICLQYSFAIQGFQKVLQHL